MNHSVVRKLFRRENGRLSEVIDIQSKSVKRFERDEAGRIVAISEPSELAAEVWARTRSALGVDMSGWRGRRLRVAIGGVDDDFLRRVAEIAASDETVWRAGVEGTGAA